MRKDVKQILLYVQFKSSNLLFKGCNVVNV